MKKALVILSAVALSISLFSSVAFASGNSPVVGTFTFSDHGQGGWTGGALLAGGGATGGGSLSFANGQVVSKLKPTSWSWDGEYINLCWTITDIKGTSGFAGYYCEDLPVTGTPVVVPDPDTGGGLATVRVTLNH